MVSMDRQVCPPPPPPEKELFYQLHSRDVLRKSGCEKREAFFSHGLLRMVPREGFLKNGHNGMLFLLVLREGGGGGRQKKRRRKKKKTKHIKATYHGSKQCHRFSTKEPINI